ncbi:hypothetical protein HR45_10670 [Shewanella mangrovi]|uniref:Uncharacterized protein n=1 Tax=Shewanella mangrovi TaxID=1515746 RepID=A0A094JC47_9GAMM|nr:hypothetical protein [Shewanella mangrovi]KFZ37470.1 hypothetical protein HR45_10670 [Shewanella mangrovi]
MSKKQDYVSAPVFWAQRIIKTSLRTLHIVGVCGASGGILFAVEGEHWYPYWLLALISGALLMLWEIIREPSWLIQLKGVLTIAKIALLGAFFLIPQYMSALFFGIIVLSVIVSHGPAGLRHYSIYHRRCINLKHEIKG